jgi:hypothetical protein
MESIRFSGTRQSRRNEDCGQIPTSRIAVGQNRLRHRENGIFCPRLKSIANSDLTISCVDCHRTDFASAMISWGTPFASDTIDAQGWDAVPDNDQNPWDLRAQHADLNWGSSRISQMDERNLVDKSSCFPQRDVHSMRSRKPGRSLADIVDQPEGAT